MRILSVLTLILLSSPALADEPVNITKGTGAFTVQTETGPVEIRRIQDSDHVITGEFAKTSRACPPFCIQPMSPAPGVTTIGELEMIAALQDPEVRVIDSRVRPNFKTGTIPGAVNMPYTEMADQLETLGCEPDFEGYECKPEVVPTIALFCNGPWCGQSPTAIRRIIKAGYPAEKILYYRQGMQGWRMLGLTVSGGE